MRVGTYLVTACLILTSQYLLAQTLLSIKPKKPIVCYGKSVDQNTVLNPPKEYLNWLKNKNARVKTATFEVTYNGFTDQAKAAFQKAVDIWSTLITSSQTIHVSATWQPLDAGVLGSAIWGNAYANFPEAQQIDTYYPVALAEKMANKELNASTDADIVANFSSTTNWSYNLNGVPVSGKYDLVTVVLHELGHGLGFVDSYSIEDEFGVVGIPFPMIYDLAIENGSGQNLFINFASPSTDLKAQLISKNIFYNSPQVLTANSASPAKIYAPQTFSSGSSISHLDETTFPSGNSNSLMTPQIGMAEVMQDPGPIVKGAFSDMGWIFTRIDHDKLLNRESTAGPFVIKAKIISEAEPVSEVFLHYNTGGVDTDVAMVPTANPNEYSASIPSTNVATTYSYFISTNDALRSYTNPGKRTAQGKAVEQTYFKFITGPDTEAPVITHSVKEYILNTDTELKIDAVVTDNLGVDVVSLNYLINNVAQTPKLLPYQANDTYSFTIDLPVLNVGDIIKYRISATDISVAGNKSYSPSSSGYNVVNVTGIQPAQDSYSNNFNTTSHDFFGEGFSIFTPIGFGDSCINSEHPYLEGFNYPDEHRNTFYELLIPIRVKAVDATIKFDEIVLVEPGQSGIEFGDDDFFDYVIVEGSTDGGVTWIPVDNGYDSNDNNDWLTRYNSASSGNNSTAVGDPTLYRTRILNLLNKFTAGQEVVLRFRLYSDPYSSGWGWAIDNLKIQIDETPPQILHDHIDYVLSDNTTLPIHIKVSDASGVQDLKLQYNVNDEAYDTYNFELNSNIDLYELDLTLEGATAGDTIHYRIVSTDIFNNASVFPPVSGYVKTVVFQPGNAINSYTNNFNTSSNDFIGNFYEITTPTGFTDAMLNSNHFYSNGQGIDLTSNYSYMLNKPIILDSSNPYIRFDEIAIVEGHISTAQFGSEAFNDYVIVEGSDDGGITWKPFLDGYDVVGQSAWVTAFSGSKPGTKSMYKTRTINMLSSNDFQPNDHVLIRFRLFANTTKNGWGWAIDNLYVQGIVTGTDELANNLKLKVYPNPAQEKLKIEFNSEGSTSVKLGLINMQGKILSDQQFSSNGNSFKHEMNVQGLPAGLYILKVESNGKIFIRKFIKEM